MQHTKLTYRHLLFFYILVMYIIRKRKKKQSHLQLSKRIKHIGVSLTKEVRNYILKTMRHWWEKLKRTLTDGKIRHAYGSEELEWSYDPRQSTDSMQSLSKYHWHFPTVLEQIILKFVWNHKRLQLAKAIFRKNEEQNWRDHAPWV